MLKDLPTRYPIDKDVQQVTAFSDSIVISHSYEDMHAIDSMLEIVKNLQEQFLMLGYLTRGGMTVGKMYHDDGIVFGPAFVEAYTLESKIAVYPRIALGNELVERYSKVVRTDLFDSNVRNDFDGIKHVRLFHNEALIKILVDLDDGASIDHETSKIDHRISHTLANKPSPEETKENHTKLRAAIKYDWLKNYFKEYQSDVARLKKANSGK